MLPSRYRGKKPVTCDDRLEHNHESLKIYTIFNNFIINFPTFYSTFKWWKSILTFNDKTDTGQVIINRT